MRKYVLGLFLGAAGVVTAAPHSEATSSVPAQPPQVELGRPVVTPPAPKIKRSESPRRLNDPTYIKFAQSLTLPQALAIYNEVLTKLQQLYADHDRASIDRLYHSGLDELTGDLTDPAFNADSESIKALIRTASAISPKEASTAREAVKTLALAAHRLNNVPVGLTVLECANGACAGLDDYTIYLHPNHLITGIEPASAI